MAAIASIQSGLWSAAGTWAGGVVPGASDSVTIAAGHTVTVDGAYTVGADAAGGLVVSGTLKASRALNSTLTLRTTPTVSATGVWDWGTVADPIPAAVQATIITNDSAAPASRKYGLIFGVPTNFGGVRFHGAGKTVRTQLTASATSTDTVLQVQDAAGWQAGDKLVLDRLTALRADVLWRQVASVSGNTVTLTAAAGVALPVGAVLGNLSRNVKIMGAVPQTYQSHCLIWLHGSQPAGTVTLANFEVCASGGGSASLNNTFAGAGLAVIFASTASSVQPISTCSGVSAHTIASIAGAAVTHAPVTSSVAEFLIGVNQAARLNVTGLIASNSGITADIAVQGGGSADFLDATIIGGSQACSGGFGQGPVNLVFTGGYISCVQQPLAVTGITTDFVGVRFGALEYQATSALLVYGRVRYLGCTFSQAPATALTTAAGAATPTLQDACMYPVGMLPPAVNSASLATAAEAWELSIRNGNGTVQQRLSRAGLVLSDTGVRLRGTASLGIQPWFTGRSNTYSRSIPVQAGQSLTLLGYVRRNAAFGAGDAVLTLSGLGLVPVSVTAPTSPDVWHPLTISTTASATGELTLTFSGTSSGGLTAACWLDGIAFPDYVPSTRHYGYVFDGLPYVTVDPVNTLNEVGIQALGVCASLDDVYDALTWYAASNQDAPLPYTRDGGTLVFGARNVVLDPAAVALLSVSSTEVRIKAGALQQGAKITSIRTTGVVSAVGGASTGFGYVDANGDSYLSFSGIDSWQVFAEAGRATLLGSGGDRYRYVYAGGVTYYLTVVASGIEYRMTAAPTGAGETAVTLSQAALLTALQAQVAALGPAISGVRGDTTDIKAATGLIKVTVL